MFPIIQSIIVKIMLTRDGQPYTNDWEALGAFESFSTVRGMKPRDLGSFLGWFMWTRYYTQRKLNVFVPFLKSAAEVRPPSHFSKLSIADMEVVTKTTSVDSDEDFV